MRFFVRVNGDTLTVFQNTELDFECVTCACQRQWLYLLGDEGVVYSEPQRHFAGLDSAGISAYRALDAGAEIEDLRLAGNRHSSAAVSDDGLEAIRALTYGIFPDDESSDESQEDWSDPTPSVFMPSGAVNIEIQGTPISVVYPPGPWAEICRDSFRDCAVSDQAASWCISAQPTEDGWAICVNECKFFTLRNEQQLGLGLMHAVRSLLYARGDYDIAFHAAMIADDDCGIMLCAPREHGKSTLAAYLVARGFDLLADEPALLRLDDWSISPLNMPISLKEGSWSILQRHLPQLAGSPVHLRSDGIRIRMVYPPSRHCSTRSRRLTHIVFPRFAPSSPAELERLSLVHTLRLLNEGGMLLANKFTREDFEALLQSVQRTPSYRLQYTSLDEALRMLQEIGCIEKVP